MLGCSNLVLVTLFKIRSVVLLHAIPLRIHEHTIVYCVCSVISQFHCLFTWCILPYSSRLLHRQWQWYACLSGSEVTMAYVKSAIWSSGNNIFVTSVVVRPLFSRMTEYDLNSLVTHITRDKTWWRHQMETFSALLALCVGNSPVTGEFPAQKPVTRSFDVSLIWAWINIWENNREAGELRRYRAHYDAIVMIIVVHAKPYKNTAEKMGTPADRSSNGLTFDQSDPQKLLAFESRCPFFFAFL